MKFKGVRSIRELLLPLLLLGDLVYAQDEILLSNYNFLSSPKETEVKFSFTEISADTIGIRIIQPQILDFTSKVDTFVNPGIAQCVVKLALESPRLFQIEIDSTLDHIFLVPGESTEIVIPADSHGEHINMNPSHNQIENYYRAKFNLLKVQKYEIEAFQFLLDYPSLTGTVFIVDSISDRQFELLSEFRLSLPDWFLSYEKKNIQHTGLAFKLSNAYNLLNKGILTKDDGALKGILREIDYKDEVGLLTPLYLSNLSMAAMTEFCSSACFTYEDEGIIQRHAATLKGLKEFINEEIQNAFAFQKLARIYSAPQTLPEAMVEEFEAYITDSAYDQRLNERKYPVLDGKDAPNFFLKDTQAVFRALKDFQNKIVLLNFWFVGCKPCKEEVPFERNLVETFADMPFQLVSICMTSEEGDWRDQVIRDALPGVNLYANENWTQKLSKEYNIVGYPQYVLIDHKGKVVNGMCLRPSSSDLIPLIHKYIQD